MNEIHILTSGIAPAAACRKPVHRPKASAWASAPVWRRRPSAQLADKGYNFGADQTNRFSLALVLKIAVCVECFIGARDAQVRGDDDQAEMPKDRAQNAQTPPSSAAA